MENFDYKKYLKNNPLVEKKVIKEQSLKEDFRKEIKFHLDTFRKGTIDGEDLANAVEEIIFGDVKAPGMMNEAVAKTNTILVTRLDNGNTDMQFPNPTELDNDVYADALEMAEDKYAMGTKIEFIYMDVDGKAHEGELTLKGESDYEGPYWDEEDKFREETQMTDTNIIDMFDEFS